MKKNQADKKIESYLIKTLHNKMLDEDNSVVGKPYFKLDSNDGNVPTHS